MRLGQRGKPWIGLQECHESVARGDTYAETSGHVFDKLQLSEYIRKTQNRQQFAAKYNNFEWESSIEHLSDWVNTLEILKIGNNGGEAYLCEINKTQFPEFRMNTLQKIKIGNIKSVWD